MGKKLNFPAKNEPASVSQKSDILRRVWEVFEDNGERTISDWDIPKRMAGALQSKVDKLRTAEVDVSGRVNLPDKMCAGPNLWGNKWIYKLRIEGQEALRPMFCLGPVDNAAEWTMLARAKEKDRDTTEQKAAAGKATLRRAEVIANTRRRVLFGDDDA
jgi:hypothetical protein